MGDPHLVSSASLMSSACMSEYQPTSAMVQLAAPTVPHYHTGCLRNGWFLLKKCLVLPKKSIGTFEVLLLTFRSLLNFLDSTRVEQFSRTSLQCPLTSWLTVDYQEDNNPRGLWTLLISCLLPVHSGPKLHL